MPSVALPAPVTVQADQPVVVPVLVWLYLFFFGLPIFFGVDIPAFWCAVLVLALWGASEVGEVVRGGLNSLARGQQVNKEGWAAKFRAVKASAKVNK